MIINYRIKKVGMQKSELHSSFRTIQYTGYGFNEEPQMFSFTNVRNEIPNNIPCY